jgi:Sec-independent protein translocase protein TatA
MRLVFGEIVEAVVALGSLIAIFRYAFKGMSWVARRRQESSEQRERQEAERKDLAERLVRLEKELADVQSLVEKKALPRSRPQSAP